ncbi:MAG: hypothetical protein DYH13_04775 [Alphaproteobacteria bacterium PRO2]|nr:hypothetical protein [Alphaproteobacteria bacterium PRO2]
MRKVGITTSDNTYEEPRQASGKVEKLRGWGQDTYVLASVFKDQSDSPTKHVTELSLYDKCGLVAHFQNGQWDDNQPPQNDAHIAVIASVLGDDHDLNIFTVGSSMSNFRGKEGRFERGTIKKNGAEYATYEARTYDKGLSAARIPHGGPPSPGGASPKKPKTDDLKSTLDLTTALKNTWIFDLKLQDVKGNTILELTNGQWVKGNPEADELKEIVKMFSDRFAAPKPVTPAAPPQLFLMSEIK